MRNWVRQAQVDDGGRAGSEYGGVGGAERLRRENAELRRANEILKAASAFFAAELDRPQAQLVRFIDEHQDRFGVQPICRVLAEHGCGDRPEHVLRHEGSTAGSADGAR